MVQEDLHLGYSIGNLVPKICVLRQTTSSMSMLPAHRHPLLKNTSSLHYLLRHPQITLHMILGMNYSQMTGNTLPQSARCLHRTMLRLFFLLTLMSHEDRPTRTMAKDLDPPIDNLVPKICILRQRTNNVLTLPAHRLPPLMNIHHNLPLRVFRHPQINCARHCLAVLKT